MPALAVASTKAFTAAGFLAIRRVGGQDHGGVAGIAVVGQQEDLGLDAGLPSRSCRARWSHSPAGRRACRPGTGALLKVYLRTWSSVKPYLAFSQTQKAVTEASDSRIGWPFMSASVFDARVRVGDQHLRVLLEEGRHRLHRHAPRCARFMTMKLLEPTPMSTAPAASSWGTFTPGPPWTMFTSRPRLAYSPFGQGLVEAAVLGLGAPVGGEADRGELAPAALAPRPSWPASRPPGAAASAMTIGTQGFHGRPPNDRPRG